MEKPYMNQEIRISVFDAVTCDDLRDLLISRGVDVNANYDVRLAPDSMHYIYTRTVTQEEAASHA